MSKTNCYYCNRGDEPEWQDSKIANYRGWYHFVWLPAELCGGVSAQRYVRCITPKEVPKKNDGE